MDDVKRIYCDDGVTQPLGYAKDGNLVYFVVNEIKGFGNLGEARIYPVGIFDEIIPLNNFNGTTYIGTRNGKKWGLWRYREWNDNDSKVVPSDYYLFAGRILEKINEISADSFKKCLLSYSYHEFQRYWKDNHE